MTVSDTGYRPAVLASEVEFHVRPVPIRRRPWWKRVIRAPKTFAQAMALTAPKQRVQLAPGAPPLPPDLARAGAHVGDGCSREA